MGTYFLFRKKCGILVLDLEVSLCILNLGTLWIRQVQIELRLRSAGYGCVPTLQLNITANNKQNTYALAA